MPVPESVTDRRRARVKQPKKEPAATTITLTIGTDYLEAVCEIAWRDRVPVPVVLQAAIASFIEDWKFRREAAVEMPDGYGRRRRRAPNGFTDEAPLDWPAFGLRSAKPFAAVFPKLAAGRRRVKAVRS